MRLTLIPLLIPVALMMGCSPKPSALRHLESIDSTALVAVAHALNVQALKKDQRYQYGIPENDWPSEIKGLKPKIVRSTDNGTSILLFKWVSKEQGFFIPPTGYDPTAHEQSDNVRFKMIKPGIYWYSISG